MEVSTIEEELNEVVEFHVDDIVRVIAPDCDEQESLLDSVGFNDEMEDEIGNTFRVRSSWTHPDGYLCYSLEGSEWTWAHEWLELVEPAKPMAHFTEQDFESAFN